MKRLKLKRVKINFNDNSFRDFSVVDPEEYIETFTNTIKNKECFHLRFHISTSQHEINHEASYTFYMDDIESIIKEWR